MVDQQKKRQEAYRENAPNYPATVNTASFECTEENDQPSVYLVVTRESLEERFLGKGFNVVMLGRRLLVNGRSKLKGVTSKAKIKHDRLFHHNYHLSWLGHSWTLTSFPLRKDSFGTRSLVLRTVFM